MLMKILIAILTISLFLACGFSDQIPGESHQQIMNWQFRNMGDTTAEYKEAEVPGSVMTDLLKLNLIPDFFYGVNEILVQWVGNSDWEYRTYFKPSAELKSKRYQYIVFEGLDTYAWVLYKQGKFEAALEWIKKAYNNGGDSSGVVLEHYGDIYYQLGKTKEAQEYWEKAIKKTDYSELLDKKIKDGKLYE